MKQKFMVEIESDEHITSDDVEINLNLNYLYKVKAYKINDSGLSDDEEFRMELKSLLQKEVELEQKEMQLKEMAVRMEQTKTEKLANKLHEKLWKENKFSK